MGQSISTPQTKVFTPTTPVDFSASFLLKLEQSPESEFSRAQHAEKYIQDRVAAELVKLEKDETDLFQNTIKNSSQTTKETSKLDAHVTSDKIQELTAMLKRNAKISSIKLSHDANAAREQVIECLKNNSGKTLNCWHEVQEFQKLIASL